MPTDDNKHVLKTPAPIRRLGNPTAKKNHENKKKEKKKRNKKQTKQ